MQLVDSTPERKVKPGPAPFTLCHDHAELVAASAAATRPELGGAADSWSQGTAAPVQLFTITTVCNIIW